jgi:hypothetical protein
VDFSLENKRLLIPAFSSIGDGGEGENPIGHSRAISSLLYLIVAAVELLYG